MWRRSTLRLYVFSIRLLSVAEAPPHFFSPSLYRRHIVASLRFLTLSVQTRLIASLHFLTLAILIHPVIERWLVSVVEPSRNAGFIFSLPRCTDVTLWRLYVFSIRLLSVAEAPPHFFSPSLYRRHIVASLRFLTLSVQTRLIASLRILSLAILNSSGH